MALLPDLTTSLADGIDEIALALRLKACIA
jgi:hypothetical protein